MYLWAAIAVCLQEELQLRLQNHSGGFAAALNDQDQPIEPAIGCKNDR